MSLDDLGPRICIFGPSNSGKSTLAAVIDHMPHTDWQPGPEEEFIALHEEALSGESWVMDGNYTRCLPQRIARATGVILLDTSTATSFRRYLRRSWEGLE
jgi:adenylate kinase family enzyme